MDLNAKKREIFGKHNESLRATGWVPAVVYGHEIKPLSISVSLKELHKIYKAAGESTIIDLKVDGEKEPLKVLIKDVQHDPISDDLLHADFYKADLSEKVSVSVPIKVTGESPIVKSGQGIVLTLLNEIEVEALPLDLPHEIEISVAALTEIGQSITVKDLPLDHSKVSVVAHNPEDLVVKIDYAVQLEKEEEVKTVEEVEVLKEKKEEEGAEGEAKEPSAKEETKPEEKKEKK